jgi:hypothetical protein
MIYREAAPPRSLLAVLATLPTLDEDFAPIDNKSLSFLSNNCVLSREFELARNSHGLIPPILE